MYYVLEKFRFLMIIGLLACMQKNVLAQGSPVSTKALIDTSLLNYEGRPAVWPKVSLPSLSPQGGYVAYILSELYDGSKDQLVVESRNGDWRREYSGTGYWIFSGDDRELVFQKRDSLYRVMLGRNDGIARVQPIRSFRYPKDGNGGWMAYQEKGGREEVVLENLLSGQVQRFGKASWYQFSAKGNVLWLAGRTGEDSSAAEELWWVDLVGGGRQKIWTGHPGEQVEQIVCDESEMQGAFLPRRSRGAKMALWYYRLGEERAKPYVREGDSSMMVGSTLNGWIEFSASGRWLFFGLQAVKEEAVPAALPGMVKVDVWSYKDRVVNPDQLIRERALASQAATGVIRVDGNGARLLAKGGIRMETTGKLVAGDRVIVSEPDTTMRIELGGSYNYGRSYFLVSLSDGLRRWVGWDPIGLWDIRFSPDGKWLFYYALEKEQYYSYAVQEGTLHCLTKGLGRPFSCGYLTGNFVLPAAMPAGWWKDENRVLLYDRYDLWGLDPSGHRAPINITGGYGARRKLQLRLLEDGDRQEPLRVCGTGDTLLFTGFGELNKENGFAKQVLGTEVMPHILSMGPYLYFQTPSQKPNGSEFNFGMRPVKSALANCWIVQRQTASEAPNYFVTTDWIHYRQLSDVRPQERYRWLKAELVNYRQLDGTPGQGILYKPENFDAKKKYPLIIHYYEQLSHRLHEFPVPGYTEGNLNIPWFVGRGYLVFTPDIYFERTDKSGKSAGQCVYNSVIGAARFLAGLQYIDRGRMGLQGHSFGAYETNYLVTHSRLFAAACEFSGVTDLISYYLTLQIGTETDDHIDYQVFVELGQSRMGATPWQHPEVYLDQSAVLRADKVTTPLLLVHNKKDGIISWRQGVEWYLALRRVHKRVWLLQYDESSHSNYGKDAMDFTERLTQFFGYYLKGEAPPKWMTKGVPARLKRVDLGLDQDFSGTTP